VSDPAFKQLVGTHHEGLYRFALALTQREEDACDLVQQVYSTWAQTGRQLREGARATIWLYTSLHRAYLEMRRRTARLAGHPLEAGATGVPSVRPEVAEAADGKAVLGALGRLDEDYRTPLVLFLLQRHSCHDIAEILEIPVKTVLQRLARAKTEFHQALERGECSEPAGQPSGVDTPASP